MRVRVQALVDVEQQDLVQLGHGLGRPVIALHQRLAGARHHAAGRRAGAGLKTERLRHGGLQVEHQAVFAPVRHQVQPRPDQAEQGLVALDLAHFERRGQPRARQLVPAVPETGRLGHPQDHLQVAQAAGRFLAVRLQGVRRVLELIVALAQLQRFGDKEGTRVHGGVETTLKLEVQGAVTRDQARFQQRRLHSHVLLRLRHAFRHVAHARSDLDAAVPALADESLDLAPLLGALFGRLAVRQQHHHIDVGIGEQLGPAVATHRHQGKLGRHRGARPQQRQGVVGIAGQRLQQFADAAHRRALGPHRSEERRLVRVITLAQGVEFGHLAGGCRFRRSRMAAATGCRRRA